MTNYPKVNYIGNKSKLSNWIISSFPVKEGKVIDLFSGGSSVSYELKKSNYTVIGNDALYSDFVIHKAIIENKDEKIDIKDMDIAIADNEIREKYNSISPYLSNILYYDNEVFELAKLVCISEKLETYKKFLFLALIRRAMIRKLPYSRMNVPWNQIEKLRNEKYSYEKYGRKRAYHNKSFYDLIKADINNYNNAIFDNGKNNKSFHLDAYDFISAFDEKVDVIYMDPPYPHTMNKYGDFYGLYDEILNKKIDYKNLSENDRFLTNLVELIKNCINSTNYIIISLNNKTNPSIYDIKNEINTFGEITILERPHQYKVTNKENKNTTIEQLLILKVKK